MGLIVIDEVYYVLVVFYMEMWKCYFVVKKLGVIVIFCCLNCRGFMELFEVLVILWSIVEFIEKGVLFVFDYVFICFGSEEWWFIDGLEKWGVDGDY